MSDFCLKNEAYTVCVARFLLRVAPVGCLLQCTNEMHFPLDNLSARRQVEKSIFPLVSCRQYWTCMSIYGE